MLSLLLLCCLAGQASALDIIRLSSTNFFYDIGTSFNAQYAQFAITNDTAGALSNIWVKLDSFTNSAGQHSTVVGYAGGGSGLHNLGTLPVAAFNTTPIFFLQCSNPATGMNGTLERYMVRVYQGIPGAGGVELTNRSFTNYLSDTGVTGNYSVDGVTISPTNITLGSLFTVTLWGKASSLKAGEPTTFTPGNNTNWNVAAFDLVNVSISYSNKTASTFLFSTNRLYFTSPVAEPSGATYGVVYTFRAVNATAGNTAMSPDFVFDQGGGYSHISAVSSLPTISSPTNAIVMAKTANVTQQYTNQSVIYSIWATNQANGVSLQLDEIADSLPANFTYVAGSTTLYGAAYADPATTNTGSRLSLFWSQPVMVTNGTPALLQFQAKVQGTNYYVTNSAYGVVGSAVVGSSLTGNSPASNVLRVLWYPRAVDDTNSTGKNKTLTVSAPGVLANDIEPNGFTMSVTSHTAPSHGDLSISIDGAYTYTHGE